MRKIVDECGKNLDATGRIDFNAVKKQVIRSQPPRVADIPDLVEYCRVWGGLPTGVFVDELSTLCAALPSDRIVSGSFLKWMANLKNAFPTRDLPSHFVNAVTYAHAQASEGIVDGFSRFITRGEVASIGSKEKRDVVFEAEAVLRRGRLLVAAQNLEISNARRLELIAKLKIEVVMDVLDRKGRTDTRSLTEIAAEFAKSVCGMHEGTTPNSVTQPIATPAQASVPTNAIMYTDEGDAKGVGFIAVVNNGFKVGNYVMKAKGDKCVQWMINCIDDDGTVKLTKLKVDGSETKGEPIIVQLDEFIDGYRLAAQIKLNKVYPGADPRRNMHDVKVFAAKGKVMEIMIAMLNEIPAPEVFVMNVPEKKVIATKTYAVGTLKLVPVTMTLEVVHAASAKECPRKTIEIDVPELEVKVWLHPSYNSDEFVSIFWNCKMVSKREDANVELVTSAYKYKHATKNQQFAKDVFVLNAVVGVNTKTIDVDTEIIIFKDMKEIEKPQKRGVTAYLDAKQDAANNSVSKGGNAKKQKCA